MKYQKFENTEWIKQNRKGEGFDWHSYNDVVFKNCEFNDCRWNHSKFYHTRYVDCGFNDCTFDQCSFTGQHTYLGSAKYERCTFLGCTLKDVATFHAIIRHSSFPNSKIENLDFIGSGDELVRTVLEDVDFSQSLFSMTGMCGFSLNSVKLPKSGVRAFCNPGNKFLHALATVSGADEKNTNLAVQLKNCPRRALLILGDFRDKGLDPIVHSEDFLNSILSNPDEKKIFEELAAKYEIELPK